MLREYGSLIALAFAELEILMRLGAMAIRKLNEDFFKLSFYLIVIMSVLLEINTLV